MPWERDADGNWKLVEGAVKKVNDYAAWGILLGFVMGLVVGLLL